MSLPDVLVVSSSARGRTPTSQQPMKAEAAFLPCSAASGVNNVAHVRCLKINIFYYLINHTLNYQLADTVHFLKLKLFFNSMATYIYTQLVFCVRLVLDGRYSTQTIKFLYFFIKTQTDINIY